MILLAFVGILALMAVSFILGGMAVHSYIEQQYDIVYGNGKFDELYEKIKDAK